MEIVYLIIAFNLGLMSSLHCLAMCGGIVGALTVGTEITPGSKQNKIFLIATYNLGRITSYSIAGAIAGYLGTQFADIISPEQGHKLLQILSSVVLIMIGIQVMGRFTFFRWIEFARFKVWRIIQPLSRHFIPVNHLNQAMIVGLIWGWLPCALVYSVLLWTVTLGHPVYGALVMLAFGLGTLPSMFSAGIFGHQFSELIRQGKIRLLAGIIIILFGFLSYYFSLHEQHVHDHTMHNNISWSTQ